MKLLMIADDFTGALDAGVQFAKKGFSTKVLVYEKEDFGKIENADVLVVDTETRHKTAQEAYRIVHQIVKVSVEYGVRYLFKKTDSALRGNIGSELTAVLDASNGSMLHFLPAFPQMQRITVNGIHYIDGLPVKESVFGADPFEPVITSDVEELIHQQCDTCVQLVHKGELPLPGKEKTIAVYDCSADEEMKSIAEHLKEKGELSLIAGCAGLAQIIPELLGWKKTSRNVPGLPEKFLVVCGSLNPITAKQLDYAEKNGFARIRLSPEQKLEPDYFQKEAGKIWLNKLWDVCSRNDRIIIDTNDFLQDNATEKYAVEKGISREKMRTQIPMALGTVVENMICRGLCSSMLMTGGDTLLGCIHRMDNARLTPVCEFAKGIVLSELVSGEGKTHVFTKSGGFGEETLLTDMAKLICCRESA